MRQKIRRIIIFIALFLFPVTLNYLSPYVSLDGAFQGIIAGSVLVFLLMFLTGLFFSRAWCAWICPVAGLSELCATVNNKRVSVRKLRVIRYSIFALWFLALVGGFILAGGIKSINPLHLTERVISVDVPLKFITYYLVLFLLFGLTVWIGRRGACHAICWMAPFLTAGAWLGRVLHLPQLRIHAASENCIDCKKCDQKCPMSLDVSKWAKEGSVKSFDCILCGECVDCCPKHVLKFGMKPSKKAAED